VRTELGRTRTRWFLVVALAACISLFVAACGDDDDSGSGDTTATSGEPTAENLDCGLGNGEKASGAPIKIGAIATKQPGTDFTDIPNATKAYFDCVNDNGGINGHPVEMIIETEQTDPGQDAALARKLIEDDGVAAIVGSLSLIECDVNHEYYEQQGFYVIDAGIAPSCYASPNSAGVNMGPRYSSDGAVQYVLRQDVDKIVFIQSNVPGTEYIAEGPQLIADDAGVEIVQLTENVPIQDANSVAVKVTQEAGPNGAVVLNFTPPEALKILQAAEQQGLQDQVKAWGCSTPCNTDFLAEALGTVWDDKLGVNAELNVTDAEDPDSTLYRAVMEQYGQDVTGGLGSFSQMGFVAGQIATDAMLGIEGDQYTPETVNEAIKNVKNFETGILCDPWYYGEAPLHIPNNTDWTTTPQEGHMVIKEECFDISDVDPDIGKVRQIEADDPSLIGE
jgi:branched-chain amino acid transport system substrate-binding protein